MIFSTILDHENNIDFFRTRFYFLYKFLQSVFRIVKGFRALVPRLKNVEQKSAGNRVGLNSVRKEDDTVE